MGAGTGNWERELGSGTGIGAPGRGGGGLLHLGGDEVEGGVGAEAVVVLGRAGRRAGDDDGADAVDDRVGEHLDRGGQQRARAVLGLGAAGPCGGGGGGPNPGPNPQIRVIFCRRRKHRRRRRNGSSRGCGERERVSGVAHAPILCSETPVAFTTSVYGELAMVTALKPTPNQAVGCAVHERQRTRRGRVRESGRRAGRGVSQKEGEAWREAWGTRRRAGGGRGVEHTHRRPGP